MRVVIKVGTSLIAPGGQIDAKLLRGMVDQFDLSAHEYLIVTSGAIAAGMSGLGLGKLPTDVDGFFVPNGRGKPRLQRVVRKLTPALEAQCNGKSKLGRGGMISKLRAAKLASEAGVHVAIVNGKHPQGITLGMARRVGT